MERTLTITLILLSTVFTLTTVVSLTYTLPVGWDIHFHRLVAQSWARGENGMFSEVVMRVNRFPYPPLFHWLLVPSVLLNVELGFLRVLQVFTYPLVLITTTWFAWKHRGPTAGLLTLVVLMGCVAVIDGGFQLKPQALDMILLPLGLHALLTDRKWLFLGVVTFVAYSHGLLWLPLFIGPMWYALLSKHDLWIRHLLLLGLLVAPITGLSLTYLGGASEKWSPMGDTPQERWFWRYPYYFPWYYLGATCFGVFTLVYKVGYEKLLSPVLKHTRYIFSEYDTLLIWTVVGMCLLIPWWADRFIQYVSQPLALLAASHITRSRRRYAFLPLLLVVCVLFALMPWGWLAADSWYIWKGGV